MPDRKTIEVSAKYVNFLQAFSAAGHILSTFYNVSMVTVSCDCYVYITITSHDFAYSMAMVEARLAQLGGTSIVTKEI